MVWKKVGKVGVDSGTIVLADPAYTLPSYEKITKPTLKKDTAQIGKNLGVITRTGFGDGEYNVYANIEKQGKYGKRVSQIRVDFIKSRKRKQIDKLFG